MQASVHGAISMPFLPRDGIFILCGHHMKDCSMFMKLVEIRDRMTFDVHPEIYLDYEGTVCKATWFAALKKTYQDPLPLPASNDAKDRERWLKQLKEDSFVANDLVPDVADKILICSTCTRASDGNLVLYGVMR